MKITIKPEMRLAFLKINFISITWWHPKVEAVTRPEDEMYRIMGHSGQAYHLKLTIVHLHVLLRNNKVNIHCPKPHEKFPSSFGKADVITSDRRKLFINIFSKTTWKLFINLQGILKKYGEKTFNAQVWARQQPLDQDADAIPLHHLFSMIIHCSAEKDNVDEKMAMRRFPHFIHKVMKLLMNQAYD
jgi:hypothetical protein